MYLRPAELCRLKVRDVVFPNARLRRRHQKTVVTLHSFEDGIPSKTHEFDETIELDLDHHQFLTPMLQNMILKLHLQKDSSLFNLEASQIRDFLQEGQMKLHINNIGPLHPYRWRHGGASMDFWETHRDLVSIQKRGRWRAMAAARRYEKGGRLAQLLSKLPDTTQELATWASENIDEGYYNPRLLRRIP
jgi:integrase